MTDHKYNKQQDCEKTKVLLYALFKELKFDPDVLYTKYNIKIKLIKSVGGSSNAVYIRKLNKIIKTPEEPIVTLPKEQDGKGLTTTFANNPKQIFKDLLLIKAAKMTGNNNVNNTNICGQLRIYVLSEFNKRKSFEETVLGLLK